ncbi:MAG: hypothetical protein KKA73_07910 [Chloroflexi bacterium]|nr:hypothetical protein [Chloroflexota bacterium]
MPSSQVQPAPSQLPIIEVGRPALVMQHQLASDLAAHLVGINATVYEGLLRLLETLLEADEHVVRLVEDGWDLETEIDAETDAQQYCPACQQMVKADAANAASFESHGCCVDCHSAWQHGRRW